MADIVGLDTFTSYFEGFEDEYVLIGGAACFLWLNAQGLAFRSTQDLNIVVIVEGNYVEFAGLLWDFIGDGMFASLEQGSEKPQLYRFHGPETAGYPHMIELLTRRILELPKSMHLTPMPVSDEVSSLSAILLDDHYYTLVVQHKELIQGASAVPARCLIPLKAKAYLDLSDRRSKGDRNVRMNDIRKHRNDVFRLLIAMAPDKEISLPGQVKGDMASFVRSIDADKGSWSSIEDSVMATSGTRMPDKPETLDLMVQIFAL